MLRSFIGGKISSNSKSDVEKRHMKITGRDWFLDKGSSPKKITGKCGNFEKTGGGGVYPNPTSFVI